MTSLAAQIDQLQPGDIITSTTKDPGSIVIRIGTMSDVSHSMLYLGRYKVVEAVPPAVRVTSLWVALDDSPWANAWTLGGLTPDDRRKVCQFGEGLRGSPYSSFAAIQAAFGAAHGNSAGCFCSRLVAAAYDHVGVPLTNAGWGATYPGQIEKRENRNRNLRWIGWLKNPLLGDCDPRLQRK